MTSFTFRKAVREKTPLLIGLVSPSGGGKTFSALRLATGIQSVTGGKIVGIDTEARRMLHYADKFSFEYLEFGPPFSSERYCEALKAAAAESDGGVVIVDSMSHEHEGPGGYLEFHEAELDRIAGEDWKKREKATFTAWIKPAQARRRLINTILQLHCGGFVFCFRAKEKLKIMRGQEPVQLGWQAIAGEEFAFEMGVRCLLQPGAKGVPDWSAESMALGVPKISDGMTPFFTDGAQLDEKVGAALARWAAGDTPIASASQQLRACTDEATLQRVFAAAWKAADKADQKEIKAVYDECKSALKRAIAPQSVHSEEIKPTYADVYAALQKAAAAMDHDALMAAADLIQHVDGEGKQGQLTEIFQACREKIEVVEQA